MKYLALVFSNLKRKKLRTTLTLLSIFVAFLLFGFLAAITGRLAATGMGVNPVSGYFHDHLFVPASRATDAMAILAAIVAENGSAWPGR